MSIFGPVDEIWYLYCISQCAPVCFKSWRCLDGEDMGWDEVKFTYLYAGSHVWCGLGGFVEA